MKTLRDLFMEELAVMYDAEHLLVKGLPKLAAATTCPYLKQSMLAHVQETAGHITTLAAIFTALGGTAKRTACRATQGLLEEAAAVAARFKRSPTINAALICATQKIEHYEIAAYGCLHEWAGLLRNNAAVRLLEEILNEEKGANAALTELALTHVNKEALDECAEPPTVCLSRSPMTAVSSSGWYALSAGASPE